jgi:CHAT domain-containing protein
MTWAFFVSGARAMVATSWKVDSSSAEQVSVGLHRRLVLGKGRSAFTKAKALQDAQLQVLHTRAHAHPFYWAAFRLVGDGR